MQTSSSQADRATPTSESIKKAIDERKNDSGWFQRLAEFAALHKCNSFADNLVPYGQNTGGQSVRGWPDAYLVTFDGGIVAIEATTKGKHLAHWKDDLKQLKENLSTEQRKGFVWVGWAKDVRPSIHDTMHREVQEAGVPADRIFTLFQKALCLELTRPCYARIWRELLGLTATTTPFKVIDEAPIYGRPTGQTVQPTQEDFDRGYVHQPDILNEVVYSLKQYQVALVLGNGASGKTSLAISVAHHKYF